MGGGIVSVRVAMGVAQGILEYYSKEDVVKLANRHLGLFTSKANEFCVT